MQCFLIEGLSLSSIQPEYCITDFCSFIYKKEEKLRPVALFQTTNKNSETSAQIFSVIFCPCNRLQYMLCTFHGN